MTNDFSGIKNFNVSVKEAGGKVIFMRKLKEGGSEHSFGIHVAQLAGMPNQIVLRANEILTHLEKDKIKEENKAKLEAIPKQEHQLSLFEIPEHFSNVVDELDGIDVNTISPVEALLKINELKQMLKKGTSN